MNPLRPSLLCRPRTHGPVLSLLLSVVIGAALPLSGRNATSPRASSPPAQTAPPAYPDDVHVPKGCYISTLAYLAKFHLEFATESGTPLTVLLRRFDGPHTIALVSWQGRWWGRDEFSGVFDLQSAVSNKDDTTRLRALAECILDRLSVRHLKGGYITAPNPTSELSDRERCEAVHAAATLLPCASQLYWVGCNRGVIPLLFFQPSERTIAVYDPASGTATAECVLRSAPTVVTMVASELGYRANAVWPGSRFVIASATR
ncbi:MAG: hypothetical protein HZC55_24605 [Verrucomicrobia bacterium]|nr:hypothetical protein [Verrucomicrobiota bacterium]